MRPGIMRSRSLAPRSLAWSVATYNCETREKCCGSLKWSLNWRTRETRWYKGQFLTSDTFASRRPSFVDFISSFPDLWERDMRRITGIVFLGYFNCWGGNLSVVCKVVGVLSSLTRWKCASQFSLCCCSLFLLFTRIPTLGSLPVALYFRLDFSLTHRTTRTYFSEAPRL